MPPMISVVIPTYNNANFIGAAVESVLGQSVKPTEIIVVDDGSADATNEVLKRYLDSIQYLRQPNSGPSAARNRGIAAAQGELVAFLDADDTWVPDKLEAQLKCLEAQPDVSLVHSNYWRLDMSTGEVTLPGQFDIFEGDCYRNFFWRNGVQISSVLVRKECLARVGRFDENIRRASTEDYDLWFRLARYYQFAYIKTPLIFYRHHTTNATRDRIPLLEGELYVLEKAFRTDSQLLGSISRHSYHKRMFRMFFSLGYTHHVAFSQKQARRYLLKALRHRPWDAYTWLLLMASSLPAPLVREMRALKFLVSGTARKGTGVA